MGLLGPSGAGGDQPPTGTQWLLMIFLAALLLEIQVRNFADAPVARELAANLARLGKETQRAEFLIEGQLMQGYTLAYAGELAAARQALERTVAIYAERDGASCSFPTPQDPAVAALSLLAMVCWIQGDAAAATSHARDAIERAEASRHPFDIAYAHAYVAMVEPGRRYRAPLDQEAAVAEHEQLLGLVGLEELPLTGHGVVVRAVERDVDAGLRQGRHRSVVALGHLRGIAVGAVGIGERGEVVTGPLRLLVGGRLVPRRQRLLGRVRRV